VTIDDVGFVVDSGRVKEERYYPVRYLESSSSIIIIISLYRGGGC
jgi:HrpA-like RNA helicase